MGSTVSYGMFCVPLACTASWPQLAPLILVCICIFFQVLLAFFSNKWCWGLLIVITHLYHQDKRDEEVMCKGGRCTCMVDDVSSVSGINIFVTCKVCLCRNGTYIEFVRAFSGPC